MDKSESILEIVPNATEAQADTTENPKPGRKKFIAPEITVPVDVLEATTFFQAVDSGVTN